MKQIKINKIVEPVTELFAPDGTKVGDITSMLELTDVCIQIMRQSVKGYYVLFKGEVLEIDKRGRIYNRKVGFYDTHAMQLRELLGF